MNTVDLQALFDAQYQASRAQVDVPLVVRRERILRMRKLLDEHGPTLAAAVQADFGVRSQRLTEIADMFVLRTLISHTLRHLGRWMKPQKVRTPIFLQPASAMIQRQPLGVVGVVSPWNYPVQLALAPAITALAAGNRVMIKPSELTPALFARCWRMLAAQISSRPARTGGDRRATVEESQRLRRAAVRPPGVHRLHRRGPQGGAGGGGQPHAHHAGAGRQVALHHRRDRATFMTPPLKIAHGKLLNAGQTCIAPDYILLPRGREAAFGEAFRAKPWRKPVPAPSRATPTTRPSSAGATTKGCRHHAGRKPRRRAPTCRTWTLQPACRARPV